MAMENRLKGKLAPRSRGPSINAPMDNLDLKEENEKL